MADKNYGITTNITNYDDEDSRPRHTSDNNGTQEEHPVFERYISLLGILNFGFCIQGAWEGMGLMLSFMFFNGGPASVVWGCLVAAIGHIATAASLGEMASMDPTVGAQYRWSARFARSHAEFWGLIQGWLTTFAWVVGCVAGPQLLAQVIQSLMTFHDPTYEPKVWQTTLLMWAILVLTIVFNLYLRTILNTMETLGGVCHILFFVASVTVLCTLGERQSAKWVFTNIISNVSGWNNSGVAWHLGLGVVFLPLSGYDSLLHMIDETKEPRKRVPISMIASTACNAVFAFSWLIVVLFFIGDVETISYSPMPLIDIYFACTKSKTATTVLVLMHAFIVLVSAMNIVASASRLTWAFSRDKGLPFHEYFSRVNPKLQIPIQALGLTCGVVVVLSLINLGSTVALSAIISLNALAILFSYIPPIVLILIRKLSGEHPQYGPFHLGRWGIPINMFSLCFLVWGCFWMSFPVSYPVTAETMNWAGPIFVGVVLLALLDWFTSGEKRFVVPTGTYNIEMQNTKDSDRASSD